MKVLVCIPCLLTGGTEIQTLSLVKALVAAGHSPIVACYFEHDTGMVKIYENAGASVNLLSPQKSRPQSFIATIAHVFKGLKKVVKRYKPDIAHVQYMAPGAIPIIALRILGVKKIIATVHTMADIYPSLHQIHWLNHHILSAFQCITLSAEKSFFGSAGLFDSSFKLKRHDNHFTIYNNLPSYIEITQKHREGKPKTIGVVSRLEEIKGMDLIVPVFAKVIKKHPDMNLIIVGDGSQRHRMERQVIEFEISPDKILFVGRQAQNKLQSYYDRIDILLMPSRSEGFGLTAIEGMARGCVPVVANVGGLPEIVKTDCGYVHNVNNILEIADRIIFLCENISKYEQLSSNAILNVGLYSKLEYDKQIKYLYEKMREI